jgi:hypothetical protein
MQRVEAELRRLEELTKVQELVERLVPLHTTIGVVSRGDDELLQLGDRQGWHFPEFPTGTYAGYHPADGQEAVAQLESARERGAEYLLVPATALWWLDHYGEFCGRLEDYYELLAADDAAGRLYALTPRVVAPARKGGAPRSVFLTRAIQAVRKAAAAR